jgi:hypothetical protein
MNRDLEALIQAYDAAKQAPPAEIPRFRTAYESKLDRLLDQFPNLSRDALQAAVRLAHSRWVRSQQKPTTLPPRA